MVYTRGGHDVEEGADVGGVYNLPMATWVPHEVLWIKLTVELVLVQKQPGCYDV